jgi:AcrR family transcriptional regulator
MHASDAGPDRVASVKRMAAKRKSAASKLAAAKAGVLERIRSEAIALFKAHGYHGASVRELAQAVRIEAASLYYHFPSKQEILFDLFERTMDDMRAGLEHALASGATPEEKLCAVVRFHVLYHVAHQDQAFISHSELRSLTAQNRRRIVAKRDRYERKLCELLAAGVRAGEFRVDDVRMTAIGILTMCSAVSDWFAGGGRLTAHKVADRYIEMVMRLVREPRGTRQSARGDVRRPRKASRLTPPRASAPG